MYRFWFFNLSEDSPCSHTNHLYKLNPHQKSRLWSLTNTGEIFLITQLPVILLALLIQVTSQCWERPLLPSMNKTARICKQVLLKFFFNDMIVMEQH